MTTSHATARSRITPADRLKPRPDILARLHRGMTDRAIAAETGADRRTVAAHRQAHNIPPAPLPPARNRSTLTLEEKWATHTTADGEHLLWTGRRTKASGTPVFTHHERTYTARKIAFRMRTGRDPVGQARAECGVELCVAPAHVDDEPIRTRDRSALAALTGRTSTQDECHRGHSYAEHRRYLPGGSSYCGACNTAAKHTTEENQ